MNKGFTLVEVLAVIIVLSALILVVAIVVKPVVDTSKENLSDVQIKNIESAAKSYYIKEGMENDFIDIEEIRSCVNVEDLIESGYIDKDEIMDPEKEETVDGSVKIIYRANNYSYEYQDKKCTNYDRGIICERVESTDVGNVPKGNFEAGDKYKCEVKPGIKYNFYVLSVSSSNGVISQTGDKELINLILDSNINSKGETITTMEQVNEDKGLVAWITAEDYIKAGGEDLRNTESCVEGGCYCSSIDYGPITAMDYLYNATKDWINIPNVIFQHDNKVKLYPTLNYTKEVEYHYSGFSYNDNSLKIIDKNEKVSKSYFNAKTRLPSLDEVEQYGHSQPNWLRENLEVLNITGYMTLTSLSDFVYITSSGGIGHPPPDWETGVRPVITIPKSLID